MIVERERVLRALWLTAKWSAAAGLVVVIGIVGYLVYVDSKITSTFEGRRWSVPAQVYAAPVELYPGLALSLDEFTDELERVGYTRSARGDVPGEFAVAGDTLHVVLRPFEFVDGQRDTLDVTVEFRDGAIDTLSTSSSTVASVRLEPPLIGSFFTSHGEDRVVVPPDAVPVLLTDTLKAVEDQHFDSHPGFDVMGILRALLVNLREGEITQGGSTLTQQLVKSYFLDNRQTVERKLREVAMAVILELRFEKEDLLNAYVNEIFLGQDGARAIHGFGLGSRFYLNKPLDELDPSEIALLVAIIRGPSYYNPYAHPERALARRDRVLTTMRQHGLIDEASLEANLAKPDGPRHGRRHGRLLPGIHGPRARGACARLRSRGTGGQRLSCLHDAQPIDTGRRASRDVDFTEHTGNQPESGQAEPAGRDDHAQQPDR